MERRYPEYDLIRRSNDSSRFIEERSDGKLSRYVLESSGRGNPFTDFNGSIGHDALVGTE
ncbi:hypothetical protein [Hyella patelloides]|uniref:hypothetical protein n=1 Tax=Hyella patelloides TaxID=1982969 RepID=UPI00119F1393|nr:hypothetical protein [Hyella patelloides]